MPNGNWNQPLTGVQPELSSTAALKGASLVGIEDAAGNYAATDVEAALAEGAARGVKSRTVNVTHATLTEVTNGVAQAVNIGAALPAGAVVVAHEVVITTLFSGGTVSAVSLDVGGTDADAVVAAMDVFTGAATGALSPGTGVHAQGAFSAEQLTATFTPDGGNPLADLDAGDLDVTVWYMTP